MDPRVKTGSVALGQQFNLSLEAYRGMEQTYKTVDQIQKLRTQIKALTQKSGSGQLADALTALEKKAAAISGEGRTDAKSPNLPGGTIDMRNPNFTALNNGFLSLIENLQSADVAPTLTMISAAAELQRVFRKLEADWMQLRTKDVVEINAQLRNANLTPLVTQ